jgi:hypothetical protein
MGVRASYPKHRPFQHWQLKVLLKRLEANMEDLTTYVLTTNEHQEKLKDSKNIVDEIALRLD